MDLAYQPNSTLCILMVVDEFPSISTPFILNQITGLIDRGQEVWICSRTKGDTVQLHEQVEAYDLLNKVSYLLPVPERWWERFRQFRRYAPDLLRRSAKHFFESINVFKHGRYAASLRYFSEVYGFKELRKFDIIHAQFGPLGVMVQRLREAGLIEGKLVTHFRGYDVSQLIRFEGEAFYQHLFRRGDLFLANCDFFRQRAICLGAKPEQVLVQYSGVNVAQFEREVAPRAEGSPARFITVARLSGKKGIRYILEAMAILKKRGFTFRYEIIGDGPLRNELEALGHTLELMDWITFHGAQRHSFISKALSESDIFVTHNVTGEDGDQDAPVNTIKEAMLAKLPVVATYHGGIPEMIEHGQNGYLVAERDVNGLAEQLIDLLSREDEWTVIGTAGRNSAKAMFSHDALNDLLLWRYYELIYPSQDF